MIELIKIMLKTSFEAGQKIAEYDLLEFQNTKYSAVKDFDKIEKPKYKNFDEWFNLVTNDNNNKP